MEKIELTLENGKIVNLNKNQIAYFYKVENKYTIVMSTGDVFAGITKANL